MSFAVHRDDLEYMAISLGYSYGVGCDVSWNQEDAPRIFFEWAARYQVDQHIREVYFFKGNLNVHESDRILNEVFLRTVLRPKHRSPMSIPLQPLPAYYEAMLGDASSTYERYVQNRQRRFRRRVIVASAAVAVVLTVLALSRHWLVQHAWPWAKAHPFLLGLVVVATLLVPAVIARVRADEPAAGLGFGAVFASVPAFIGFGLAYWWFGLAVSLSTTIALVAAFGGLLVGIVLITFAD